MDTNTLTNILTAVDTVNTNTVVVGYLMLFLSGILLAFLVCITIDPTKL